jgi:Na+-transporting NADH:ubiquinone oxidoreductase subunit NqrF
VLGIAGVGRRDGASTWSGVGDVDNGRPDSFRFSLRTGDDLELSGDFGEPVEEPCDHDL